MSSTSGQGAKSWAAEAAADPDALLVDAQRPSMPDERGELVVEQSQAEGQENRQDDRPLHVAGVVPVLQGLGGQHACRQDVEPFYFRVMRHRVRPPRRDDVLRQQTQEKDAHRQLRDRQREPESLFAVPQMVHSRADEREGGDRVRQLLQPSPALAAQGDQGKIDGGLVHVQSV